MAKLPQLVSALASVDERDRKTLDWIARIARESGHLPTTGRGSAAADMGIEEAAKLLIAVSVAEAAPNSAKATVPLYWNLTLTGRTLAPADDAVCASIGMAPNFGHAVAALIEAAPILLARAHRLIDDIHADQPAGNREAMKAMALNGTVLPPIVQVEFRRPQPFAVIRVLDFTGGNDWHEWRYSPGADMASTGFAAPAAADAISIRRVGLKTLLALAAAVADESA